MATSTLIYPQYASNLIQNAYFNKNYKNALLKPSAVAFHNFPITIFPFYAHSLVNNTTKFWKNNVDAFRKLHTIGLQPKSYNNTMFSKSLSNKKKTCKIEATSSSKDRNNEDVATYEKCIEYHNKQVSVIALSTLLMSTTNKILYKMALVPMKNYPFFLAQILTFGYVIVYSSILLYRYKIGLVTRDMLKLPKKPYIAIGFLEALGLAIGMVAATNLPGASIPILNQV